MVVRPHLRSIDDRFAVMDDPLPCLLIPFGIPFGIPLCLNRNEIINKKYDLRRDRINFFYLLSVSSTFPDVVIVDALNCRWNEFGESL